MKCRGLALVLALVLSACGSEEAAVPEEETEAAATSLAESEIAGPERRILAFGDSLFAGYRLGDRESYPGQLEAALRGEGLNVRVTNAGVSGDTSAAGLQRIAFVLDSLPTPPDLAIVELGGNDLLRAIPPAETRANLEAILTELRERGIPVLLMGMRAPPNLGTDFVAEFDGLYPELARRHGAALVPFFLEPVYDKPALIQEDRIHPTAEGIEALVAATADDVARALPDER
jgi:acyl-CoA thioesterase-1